MSVIVVSDVHLGDETSNYKDFSKFIDWIAALEKEGGKTVRPGGKEIHLKPPEKLILLGDIVEMWSPRDNEPKYIIQESAEPFGKLTGLRCEKVFVLGNHDEDIAEYLDMRMTSKDGMGIKGITFKINNSDFTIINRHYPEDPQDKIKGSLQIGEHKYFFIHGQQFDKLFISAGPLASVPTYTAKISNMFSKIFPFNGWSLVAVFAISDVLYLVLKTDVLLTLAIISFVLSIPRLFTYLQDKFWEVFGNALTDKPKHRDIKTIIEKKYYDISKDKTGWDVNIVFGHTHVPEIRPYKFSENGKEHIYYFLNTGSWTQEKGPFNTFVYLDETGYYLLKWEPGGDVELIPAGEVISG